MIAALACFLMMSFLLILLANVKGDLQDGFIQKVKFISSHAMIAMWIGYGLVFVGAFILKFVKVKNIALILAAAMILVAGVTPIVQNYTNDQLVFEMGGSEQNGHTFGWQFGAYQLDGAKAINEQLVADEEPLPDPTYPPAMEKGAVFFGGTDPGRFVPTYMIYSANFRPDVYLITQNALADDTYMSVERDLYGDEIWIPSKEDSAEAFNIYVDEVQRGVRPANGDLKIENGRVQVTGALGVMEINGILTKMMFDHDRLNRAFYIEESYVIQWMYPYLSPHGLIMKINKDKVPYDRATAEKDADFWDWYVRRLTKDPMYRRDFAGQKSFSKLRAAIAGLYVRQGRYREAMQAYREACLLYPASPEATFRYAQECLLPFSKWDEVLDMMDFTDRVDPNNKRTINLRNYVERVRHLTAERVRLEAKRKGKEFSREDAFLLATCYSELGRSMEGAQLIRNYLPAATDVGELKLMAMMFLDAGLVADAEIALNKYLKANPTTDAMMWIELSKLQHRNGRKRAAQQSFINGYRINSQEIFRLLQKDQELYEIAAPLFQKRN
jgi:tetratricopeptide (TPR) repeat protein